MFDLIITSLVVEVGAGSVLVEHEVIVIPLNKTIAQFKKIFLIIE